MAGRISSVTVTGAGGTTVTVTGSETYVATVVAATLGQPTLKAIAETVTLPAARFSSVRTDVSSGTTSNDCVTVAVPTSFNWMQRASVGARRISAVAVPRASGSSGAVGGASAQAARAASGAASRTGKAMRLERRRRFWLFTWDRTPERRKLATKSTGCRRCNARRGLQ